MRILVTGAAGQVGARVVGALGGHDVLAASRADLDLADRDSIEAAVAGFGPDAVVNCAAMTSVDGCETDPEQAFAVNALGVRWLTRTAERFGHVFFVAIDPGRTSRKVNFMSGSECAAGVESTIADIC